jgi:hypothetical protein
MRQTIPKTRKPTHIVARNKSNIFPICGLGFVVPYPSEGFSVSTVVCTIEIDSEGVESANEINGEKAVAKSNTKPKRMKERKEVLMFENAFMALSKRSYKIN